ncbi:Glyoxalase/bleomycin resistance protein/dioxygenase [Nitrosotalea sinensis]|jgi:methylmalonyl-CoA/ethylmalonyl-CoA epimerase|uniref:Glyoxalase/bleomycin resistance protein/dioxygenase n=1 Tax=Nitrosotalea sinensis TaxID=1499975 RepID=A0A2H1EIL7_9ARCH|nr:methylmalonyl-CoA epimerase [Candidatus Nitrosotalea sinensis]SHO47203.1 Glyoxalase/bleomycin resistance protein/dioxygenase [Candidatus Nitrosotalea sinensis]
MRLDHVAIAVNNLDESVKQYKEALAIHDVEFETVESEGVRVAILHLNNSRIELMEATKESSPIKKFLTTKGEGLHHIALETEGIEKEVDRMKTCGIRFLGEIRPGSRGTKIIFMHPKSLNGVLAELCSHPKS